MSAKVGKKVTHCRRH